MTVLGVDTKRSFSVCRSHEKGKDAADGDARVVGYCRVSTSEQVDSGLGLEAQRRAIRLECERRGWELVAVEEDAGVSGKVTSRPGLQRALDAC